MKLRYIMLTALFLVTSSLAEATLKPSDFAYGLPLSLKERSAVCRVSLPLEVYKTVTRDDLADIRIFNSKDATVPHILRMPENKTDTFEHATALPFFPLYNDKNPSDDESLTLRLEKSGDQTMIHLQSGNAQVPVDHDPYGYIIDARGHKNPIHHLDIVWQDPADSFMFPVSVETSKDMTHWGPTVSRTTLAHLQYQEHEISRRRIPLSGASADFYRLTWPSDSEGLTVTEVLAIYRNEAPEPVRQWIALTGETWQEDESLGYNTFEYKSPARLPVERVRMQFVEENALVKAILYSRPDRISRWVRRKSGVFYHLSFDQTTLVNDTIPIAVSLDRFWKVAMVEGAFSDPAYIPKVELGWLPHELIFVTQGQGPYTLAYGSAKLVEGGRKNGLNATLSQVMNGKMDELIKEAMVLPKVVLGGPGVLLPSPPPKPWRAWLLWAVLLIGVGVIAKMALSLGKAIRHEESV